MTKMKDYMRTMVISNQSFSKSNSNGRTLGLLFDGWPKDKLCQFCLSATDADTDVCTNYFVVSDSDALQAVKSLGRKKADGTVKSSAPISVATKSRGRNALISLLRDAVWNSRLWQGKAFKRWCSGFNPELVMVQSGDSAFMLSLAGRIAKRFKVPLVIFNTEGYVFFDHNFLKPGAMDALFFPIFRKFYRRVFMRTFRKSAGSIYLNSQLENDYQALREHRSTVIYNSSTMRFNPSASLSSPPTFAYLGNLGIKRPEALAEFASVLQEIDNTLSIDVYGKMPATGGDPLNRTAGLNYHGSVSYDRVKGIIAETDFLIHVEKDDPVMTTELRYAFSTKIADSICSGRNFIVYAPASLACSRYIADTGAAWLASSKDELKQVLTEALTNAEARRSVIERAHNAASNHTADSNKLKFRDFLLQVAEQ